MSASLVTGPRRQISFSGIMLSLSLISAAIALSYHASSVGRFTELRSTETSIYNSSWHTIPLFQQVPHARFKPRTNKEVHACIKAEVDRATAKQHHTFDRFKEATGEKHFLDKRSEANLTVKRADGEMPLTPVRSGVAWIGMVIIGSGFGQARVRAKFDTGALDLIIHHSQYDFIRSSSAQHTRDSFQLGYSDGTTAEIRVMLDTVFVAGLVATDLAIGDATYSTADPYDYEAVVGVTTLVRPEVSALRRPGLIPTLYAQGSIPDKVFCFGLWKGGGMHAWT
ncbi:hypothetical protein V8E36_008823 [Tilletia maclaganii]